jgi:hypothetical protein
MPSRPLKSYESFRNFNIILTEQVVMLLPSSALL